MFLFHPIRSEFAPDPIHFLKFWAKSQPQRSYEKGSYKEKRMYQAGSPKHDRFVNSKGCRYATRWPPFR